MVFFHSESETRVWPSIMSNLGNAQRWSKSVFIFHRCCPHSLTFGYFKFSQNNILISLPLYFHLNIKDWKCRAVEKREKKKTEKLIVQNCVRINWNSAFVPKIFLGKIMRPTECLWNTITDTFSYAQTDTTIHDVASVCMGKKVWLVSDFAQQLLPNTQHHATGCANCLNMQLPTVVNLRNKTGEERRRQTLCNKRDNNFVWNNFTPNFTFLRNIFFLQRPENINVKRESRHNTQLIALSCLSHTSILPFSSFCRHVA